MGGNGDFQPFPISKDLVKINHPIEPANHKELVGFGVPGRWFNEVTQLIPSPLWRSRFGFETSSRLMFYLDPQDSLKKKKRIIASHLWGPLFGGENYRGNGEVESKWRDQPNKKNGGITKFDHGLGPSPGIQNCGKWMLFLLVTFLGWWVYSRDLF